VTSAAAVPAPIQPPQSLAERIRTAPTPVRLKGFMYAVWALAAVLFLLGEGSVASALHAIRTVGKDTAPSIIAAQEISSALADLDANAGNYLLGNKQNQDAAKRAFEERRVTVTRKLVDAARNITYGEAESVPINTLLDGLGRYLELYAEMRYRKDAGDATGALGVYAAATDLMHTKMLPAGAALDAANLSHLESDYAAEKSSGGMAGGLSALLAGVLVFVLLWGQILLTKWTRRIFNPALVGATVVAVTFGAYLVSRISLSQDQLKIAKEDAFDSIHALWQARAVAFDANGDETRWLLFGSARAAEFERGYKDKVQKLASVAAGRVADRGPEAARHLQGVLRRRAAQRHLRRREGGGPQDDPRLRRLRQDRRHHARPGEEQPARRGGAALHRHRRERVQRRLRSLRHGPPGRGGHQPHGVRRRRRPGDQRAGPGGEGPPLGLAGRRLPRPLRPPPPPAGVRRVSQPTPVEQIDLLLAAWDERLRRMDENLVALESEAIYQILAGKAGKRPALEGATKERVGPALDAVTELFENRERLSAVVAKAREVRASISALTFWESDDKIAEVFRLLRGTSIELGQKVVALSQRNLLDQSFHEVFIEPEQLLAQMATRFQEARTVLLAVSQAWEALDPAMATIEAEVKTLRDLAAELGPPANAGGTPAPPAKAGEQPKEIPELAQAEAELARLRARVAKDPLGAQGGVAQEITPRLAALRARLEAERAARQRTQSGLAEARDVRRRLAEEHQRALRLAAEARQQIEGAAVTRLPPLLDEGLLTGLDEWLRKIEGTAEARRWSPAEVGLARWRATAEQYHATAHAAATAAEALLARRGELAGRLSARRAQAAALGARGLALDPAAEARAREADMLLRKRPVPIDEATKVVEGYEAAIVALAARRN
jgi:hypothetical protein